MYEEVDGSEVEVVRAVGLGEEVLRICGVLLGVREALGLEVGFVAFIAILVLHIRGKKQNR